MGKTKILIADDNANLLEALKVSFEREGYETVTAQDGIQALELARTQNPTLILLDVMLPGLDGYEVCRLIRQEAVTPILMLSAKVDEVDKVIGLELGADDYITKPFSVRELMARVKAGVRRIGMNMQASALEDVSSNALRFEKLALDKKRHTFARDGVNIYLSPKEFDLMALLMANPRHVFSREELLEKVWGYAYCGDNRTVDVHMVSLRKKIEGDPSSQRYLVSVRGVGYKLDDEET